MITESNTNFPVFLDYISVQILIYKSYAVRVTGERFSSKRDALHPKSKWKDKAKGYVKPNADMKYAIFNLFQAFGQVVQIVVKRNDKMRGQAFVVFKEVS